MRSLFRLLSMAAMIAVIVACGQDEPQKTNPTPPPPPPVSESINSYTIMTYGCGGANLDQYYENVLEVVSQLDVPSNINIVGQMKWSNGYNSDMSDGRGSVSRFKYNHAARNYDNEVVSDNSFMIDDPNNLAEFVEWARSEAPADEYVIIFMGHGNAYHPGFEGDNTRGIIRDDEEISYLGLSAITEAFETADAHFGMAFMMCCLMNSIEYVTELERLEPLSLTLLGHTAANLAYRGWTRGNLHRFDCRTHAGDRQVYRSWLHDRESLAKA